MRCAVRNDMTLAEKRKIRGTNRGLIRGKSRVKANLGRVREIEYTDMTTQIVAKAEQTSRNRHKGLYTEGTE